MLYEIAAAKSRRGRTNAGGGLAPPWCCSVACRNIRQNENPASLTERLYEEEKRRTSALLFRFFSKLLDQIRCRIEIRPNENPTRTGQGRGLGNPQIWALQMRAPLGQLIGAPDVLRKPRFTCSRPAIHSTVIA